MPLGAATVETLRALAQTYGPLAFQTPDGLQLRLYGLGGRVALSGEDKDRLATLAAELAAAAW